MTLQICYIGCVAEPLQLHGFAREATYVSDIAQLSDRDIARATGSGESTVRAWRSGQRNPSGVRAERLVELSSLVERLVRVMDAGYVAVWLRKPVAALGDAKPVDLIAQGDYRRVSRVVAALEGMPVS
jgi:transcriptional regulator with XRE-family HTH domain